LIHGVPTTGAGLPGKNGARLSATAGVLQVSERGGDDGRGRRRYRTPSSPRRPRGAGGVRPAVRAAPGGPAEGRRTPARRPGAGRRGGGRGRPLRRRPGRDAGGGPPAPGLPAPPADGVPPLAEEDGGGAAPHGGAVPPRGRQTVRPPGGPAPGRLLGPPGPPA